MLDACWIHYYSDFQIWPEVEGEYDPWDPEGAHLNVHPYNPEYFLPAKKTTENFLVDILDAQAKKHGPQGFRRWWKEFVLELEATQYSFRGKLQHRWLTMPEYVALYLMGLVLPVESTELHRLQRDVDGNLVDPREGKTAAAMIQPSTIQCIAAEHYAEWGRTPVDLAQELVEALQPLDDKRGKVFYKAVHIVGSLGWEGLENLLRHKGLHALAGKELLEEEGQERQAIQKRDVSESGNSCSSCASY